TGKHIAWLVIAFWTGGAFVLYFHDAPTVARGWFTGEAPLSAYWFAGLLTFTTYFLAGHMREQVCTYMCPWPRIQAALTDEHALNVTYRYDRGEPRGPHRKEESWEGRGDCIDCDQCVQVCPVGVDIREGAQLGCIHCALCIDACDQMMTRIDRPRGLIAYDTDVAVAQRAAGETPSYRLLRPRTVLYAVLIVAISALMAFGLANRPTFEVNALKDRSPPFVTLSNGSLRSGYSLKLVNRNTTPRELTISLSGLPGAEFEVVGVADPQAGELVLPVAAHGVDRYRLLVTVPAESVVRRSIFTLNVTDAATGETHANRTAFVGPEVPR
ncbi:MAG: 4Fe-4S dicluster domain-containing protein, partial [Pseudomonadota bacterium]